MTQEKEKFTDEMLTAYLDGELDGESQNAIETALAEDHALAARLAALDIPVEKIRQAMDPSVIGAPQLPPVFAAKPAVSRMRLYAPIALAASFVLGVAVNAWMQPAPPAQGGWLAAVASYQALYVTETLSNAEQDSARTEAVLAQAAETYGVVLTPATEIDGLDFKRAQVLGFKGKPLLQMAYLTPEGTPLALCLVPVSEADRGPKPSMMFDLAGVSWVENGVGYFLVGGQDEGLLDQLSNDIRASI